MQVPVYGVLKKQKVVMEKNSVFKLYLELNKMEDKFIEDLSPFAAVRQTSARIATP